eukprot:m.280675 g.280675  ORF g.280675 m.280675 type:complete len:310 (+) comp22885_c4_seq14:2148-3077(+)
MGSRLSSLRIPLSTTGHIDLRDIGITDEGLACLARFCPALLNLTISGSNITDTGIRDLLAVCTRLTALDVAHCQRVTLASLSLLKSAAKLQMVNITGIPLPVAAGMDFMRCLRLRGVCVRHSLSQLPQIESLIPDLPPHTGCTCDDAEHHQQPEVLCVCGLVVKDCLQDHLSICRRSTRACPLGCGQHMENEFFGLHLQACSEYVVKCFECRASVQRQKLAMHYQTEHEPYWQLPLKSCPLRVDGCMGATQQPDGVLHSHLSRCRRFRIVCPACKETLCNSAWSQHTQGCNGARRLLVMFLGQDTASSC